MQQQAYYATHGGLTGEYFNPDNLRHDTILVRYDGADRGTTGDLRSVAIVGKNGASVPLASIASIDRTEGPTLIEHDGLRRSVSVLGYYRKGSRGEMALDMDVVMNALAQVSFPRGYGMTVRGDMTEMDQAFARLIGSMELAAVFIFLLLMAQFRSIWIPAVMLLAIPLEFLGVFGALLLAHQSFSAVSILGIVVANGMAVSNAILLLDLVIRKRADGLSKRAAMLSAGPVRLRPILMTTIVSLIVLVPCRVLSQDGDRRVLAARHGNHRRLDPLDGTDAVRGSRLVRRTRRCGHCAPPAFWSASVVRPAAGLRNRAVIGAGVACVSQSRQRSHLRSL